MAERIGVEARTQLDLLRAARPAAKADCNALPVGRPAAATEDGQRLLDRHGAVMAAGAAADGQVGTLRAQLLKRFDGTGNGSGVGEGGRTDKNRR